MLLACVLPGVFSQHWLSWLSPRGRSLARCEGRCENLLVCGLTGGQVGQHGQCQGLMSVCCLHSKPELSRVPRQLSLPAHRPRQARLSAFTSHENGRLSSPQTNIVRKLSKSKYRRIRLGPEVDNLIVGGPDLSSCGLSRPVAERRILGGSEAGYGQFPWTALIQIYSQEHGLDKMCAGSLVQDRFILTAGHCVHYCQAGLLPNCSSPIPLSDITFKVVLGQYDILNPRKDQNIQRYYATEVYLHPDFTNVFRMREDGFLESEPTHDVALLRLDRPVSGSNN